MMGLKELIAVEEAKGAAMYAAASVEEKAVIDSKNEKVAAFVAWKNASMAGAAS